MKIKTAVFPVAGNGTRLYPLTKNMSKELIEIKGKPLILYVIEEAIRAGCKELIFVINPEKHDLNKFLREYARRNPHVSIKTVVQDKPCGLGHAVLCAKNAVQLDDGESFAVLLPDDLCWNGLLEEMLLSDYKNIIAVHNVMPQDVKKYGIVETNNNQIISIIEKPEPNTTKSTLAVLGRYIFTNKIFEFLEHTGVGKNGEIQLTDAIIDMLNMHPIYSHKFSGTHFDCGSHSGIHDAEQNFIKNS